MSKFRSSLTPFCRRPACWPCGGASTRNRCTASTSARTTSRTASSRASRAARSPAARPIASSRASGRSTAPRRRARADGVVTQQERARIDHMTDRQGRRSIARATTASRPGIAAKIGAAPTAVRTTVGTIVTAGPRPATTGGWDRGNGGWGSRRHRSVAGSRQSRRLEPRPSTTAGTAIAAAGIERRDAANDRRMPPTARATVR